jgi:hypothetical protein
LAVAWIKGFGLGFFLARPGVLGRTRKEKLALGAKAGF